MRFAVRSTAVLIYATLVVACVVQPTSGPMETSTSSTRLLAGKPMAACTIKGDYPVQAETPGLCGTLEVPEDRANPDGRQIGLRVAVVPATAADPEADPLFVLAGGPGDAGTQFFAWLPAVFEEVHARRDIVLIDQRHRELAGIHSAADARHERTVGYRFRCTALRLGHRVAGGNRRRPPLLHDERRG